jgi:hypothetical protein
VQPNHNDGGRQISPPLNQWSNKQLGVDSQNEAIRKAQLANQINMDDKEKPSMANLITEFNNRNFGQQSNKVILHKPNSFETDHNNKKLNFDIK